MLSQDEEERIRETVRRSLDNILGSHHATASAPPLPVTSEAEVQRISDAEAIIADETERYYRQMGRVRHVSTTGQVFWVTPGEKRRLEARGRRQRREGLIAKLTSRVVLVWTITFLLATLLVAYLIRTVSVAGLTD